MELANLLIDRARYHAEATCRRLSRSMLSTKETNAPRMFEAGPPSTDMCVDAS